MADAARADGEAELDGSQPGQGGPRRVRRGPVQHLGEGPPAGVRPHADRGLEGEDLAPRQGEDRQVQLPAHVHPRVPRGHADEPPRGVPLPSDHVRGGAGLPGGPRRLLHPEAEVPSPHAQRRTGAPSLREGVRRVGQRHGSGPAVQRLRVPDLHVRHLHPPLPDRPPRRAPARGHDAAPRHTRRLTVARAPDGEGAVGPKEPRHGAHREVRGAQVAGRRGRRRGAAAKAALAGVADDLQPGHGPGVPLTLRAHVFSEGELAPPPAVHQRGCRGPDPAADKSSPHLGGDVHLRPVHRRLRRPRRLPLRRGVGGGEPRAAGEDLRGPLAGSRRPPAEGGLGEGDAGRAEEAGPDDLHPEGPVRRAGWIGAV
mmetsp:Transcript_27243/g.71928  ORF Transcript_27243/g.71928 Transcript_27243/m.71928 type:complete len:370 (-) Transcript_27243:682-1791(-)